MGPHISLVIPCYNEADNLEDIFRASEALLKSCPELELILVDNGSTDRSKEILDKFLDEQKNPRLRAVFVPKNLGYGHGINMGLQASKGSYLAWTHADLQTDLQDVARAYHDVIQGSHRGRDVVVKGRRTNRSFLDGVLTAGMSVFASLILGKIFRDTNAQPKVFPRSLYDSMSHPPQDFSLDLYLLWLAKLKGYSIECIPVRFNDRLHGEAKGGGGSIKNRIKIIRRTLRYILKLRRSYSQVQLEAL